jgi:beta-glucanase (GH16 family)
MEISHVLDHGVRGGVQCNTDSIDRSMVVAPPPTQDHKRLSRRSILKLFALVPIISTTGALVTMSSSNNMPAAAPVAPTPANYTFADEFNGQAGTAPNTNNWVHIVGKGATIGGNQETETYTDAMQNAHLDGSGHLAIVATNAPGGGFNSARLTTQGKFSQQYGSWEASIAIQNVPGCWPAAWFLGVDQAWPACGEIDMLENYGSGFTDGTVWDATATHKAWGKSAATADTGFHVYRMDWNENEIAMYRDGQQYVAALKSQLSPWPFEANGGVYMILNIATDGTGTGNVSPNPAHMPVTMLIDYVHAWQ